MTPRITITSVSNPRVKRLRSLRRRPGEAFMVEGLRQVGRALEAGALVRELYVAPELHLGAAEARVTTEAARLGASVHELGRAAFLSVAGRPRPDGVLAVVERWSTGLTQLEAGPQALIAVAHGIERPGNLGAIVRTCAGAAVDALIVCDARTDLFHPDTVQASVGTFFRVTLAQASTEEAISWLRARGLRICVTSPRGEHAYWEAGFGGPSAVVVGSERNGVGDDWLRAADEVVTIPMPGPADSLNVAVAAGIVLFEASRLRGSASGASAADAEAVRPRRAAESRATSQGLAAAKQR